MPSATEQDTEQKLAVHTSWGLFGAFGIGFVLSGFEADLYALAVLGFATLIVGFIAHLIINRIYGADFRQGEIATAFALFGVSALTFIADWLLDSSFSEADLVSGFTGFAVIILAAFAYVATRHGLKDAFSMFHVKRQG